MPFQVRPRLVVVRERSPEPPLFEHSPLTVQTQEMRLLKVLPLRSTSGLVCCEMRHARLDDTADVSFDAVSYMRGPEVPLRKILVNDRPFSVRPNLSGFLEVARETRPNQWLWIDALSIAQTNGDEKQHQIRLMRDVFRSAKRTLIWLSSGDEAIESLMHAAEDGGLDSRIDIIRAQRESNNRKEIAKTWRKETRFEGVYAFPVEPEKSSMHSDLTRDRLYFGDDILLRGTYALDQHPYWNRVWIIQEVLLSSERMILCGSHELSWRQFCDIMELFLPRIVIDQIGETRPDCRNQCYNYLYEPRDFIFIGDHLRPARGVDQFNVTAILHRFDQTQCSLAHDHVYGVLALSENIQDFPVDYDSGMVELLVNTLLFCLTDNFMKHSFQRVRLSETWHFPWERSSFANSLAAKLQSMSLERKKGTPTLFRPPIAFDLLEDFPRPKIQFTISRLLLWFRGRRDSFSDIHLRRNLLTGLARHVDTFPQTFAPSDTVYLDLRADVIFIMRRTTLGCRVVGRARYETTFKSYGEIAYLTDREAYVMILDTYGSDGLHGTEVLTLSPEDNNLYDETFFESWTFGDEDGYPRSQREINAKSRLHRIHFTDIRAAVILFHLPDNQEMRTIAIRMLSTMDETDAFGEVRCFAIAHGPVSNDGTNINWFKTIECYMAEKRMEECEGAHSNPHYPFPPLEPTDHGQRFDMAYLNIFSSYH